MPALWIINLLQNNLLEIMELLFQHHERQENGAILMNLLSFHKTCAVSSFLFRKHSWLPQVLSMYRTIHALPTEVTFRYPYFPCRSLVTDLRTLKTFQIQMTQNCCSETDPSPSPPHTQAAKEWKQCYQNKTCSYRSHRNTESGH